MIETTVRTILTGSESVAARATGGIHFNAAPQNERRARIVLTTVDDLTEFNHEGRAGWGTGRIQVDCLAPTYPEAKLLAQAVRDAIDGAEIGDDVGYLRCESARDIPTAPLSGQAVPTYGVSVDVVFMTTEN